MIFVFEVHLLHLEIAKRFSKYPFLVFCFTTFRKDLWIELKELDFLFYSSIFIN